MEQPKVSHLKPRHKIMRFVKGIIDHGIMMPNNGKLVVFSLAIMIQFGIDQDGRKSIVGYLFMMGKSSISWRSKNQGIVALYSCEVKYVADSFESFQTI